MIDYGSESFAFDNNASPVDIQKAYENGLFGAVKDREQDRLFDLTAPTFQTAASGIAGSGEGKAVVLTSFVQKADETAYKEAQRTGDCVSHGTRNAVDATRITQIVIEGKAEGFIRIGATEGIYGSRGHGGQGMSCAGAARWVSTEGGVLLRQDYPDLNVDFTNYNDSYKLGMGWGRGGVPEEITKEAAKHRVRTVIRVTSLEQARDLIANGYGIAACSNLGFSSTRDENGVSRRKGSWSHCMAWLGVDARPETIRMFGGPLILIQNSWGEFNDGPIRLGQPAGSFWVIPEDANAIIRAEGIFAFSDVDGFPPKNLEEWGFGYTLAA